jgi:hypothetical protein
MCNFAPPAGVYRNDKTWRVFPLPADPMCKIVHTWDREYRRVCGLRRGLDIEQLTELVACVRQRLRGGYVSGAGRSQGLFHRSRLALLRQDIAQQIATEILVVSQLPTCRRWNPLQKPSRPHWPSLCRSRRDRWRFTAEAWNVSRTW